MATSMSAAFYHLSTALLRSIYGIRFRATALLLELLAAGLMAPPQARERQHHTAGGVRWIAGALLAAMMMVMVFAHDASAAPTFQAAGGAVSGIGPVSPAWPA